MRTPAPARLAIAAAVGLTLLAGSLVYGWWRQRPGETLGLEDVSSALAAAGFTVEPGGETSTHPFGVAGQVLLVNGSPVQVYVFPTEAARRRVVFFNEGHAVEVDGSAIMISWMAPPRIVEAGNVLVTIVLEDAERAEAIAAALSGLGGRN